MIREELLLTYATILHKKMTVLQKLSLQKVSTTKGIGNKRYRSKKVLLKIKNSDQFLIYVEGNVRLG